VAQGAQDAGLADAGLAGEQDVAVLAHRVDELVDQALARGPERVNRFETVGA
jgi:hypothetical protein